MARLSIIALLVALLVQTQAFTVPTPQQQRVSTRLAMADDKNAQSQKVIERGVSVDQDGKSNVWAIEPKESLSSKSVEENTQSALIAGGILGVAAAAAGFILTNLPDPSQF